MLSKDWHVTIRHFLYLAAFCLCFFWGMGHFFPAPQPVHGPVAILTPSPAEHEIHAIEQSQKVISQTLGGVVSVLDRPGATVFSKATGFNTAQSAQILHGAKPHTVTKISVSTIAPTPAPLASDDLSKKIYNAAYAADTKAINETTTKVDISQQETPTSRFGSAFLTNGGTGLSFAAYRHKQIDINLAAVLNNNHLSPAICPQYKIPHTSLDAGPCLSISHGIQFNFGITEQF